VGSTPSAAINLEEYPSPAEGIGLENRQAGQTAQGFESPFLLHFLLNTIIAGWSSSVARRAHNPKVAGSNPAPAINVSYFQVLFEKTSVR
jgi:hypothetical protein